MDRAEATGLGVALAGHGVLLAVLSLGLASERQPPLMSDPVEVSIVDEVALRSAAPEPVAQAPAPSEAPALGAPEQAAPPPPEPAPPLPEVVPVPPPPQPKPVPKADLPPPPRPVPVANKPKPAPPKAATAKPAPVKAAPPKAVPPAKPARAKPSVPGTGKAAADTGRRLTRKILAGVGTDPAPAKPTPAPAAAAISPVQLAGIKSAIQRQIQPCADRQADPGPGANQITVTLNLRLNRNGSLAAPPRVVRATGLTDENRRYEQQVKDRAIASYTGCAPLRGLPDELYQTAGGGWGNINMNYKLPG